MALHVDVMQSKKQNSVPSKDGVERGMASLRPHNGANWLQRAPQLPTHLRSSDILQLQRTIGNRAVSNILARKTSDAPLDAPLDTPMGAQGGKVGGEVDGETAQAIQGAKSGGSVVPKQIAAEMQSRMGVDVHHARIHTGKRAETLSRKLNAEAFTHGRDIFFDKGAYQPGTVSGKHLLAHELTHVAQQTGTNANRIQPKLRVGPANDHFEQEADQVASSVTSARADAPLVPQSTGKAVVQRRLKFKPEQLDGEVSTRGKRSGRFGFESTFSKIQRYLTEYWAAGDDMQLQFTLLTKMKAMVKDWTKRFDRKNNIDANQGLKSMSIYRLERAIDVELPKVKDKIASVNFMKTFSYGQESSKDMMITGINDDLSIGKQMKHMEKHNIAMPSNPDDFRVSDGMGGEKGTMISDTKWQSLHEQYKEQKPLGLTQANRAALYSYTGDQFRWMNPAMANNEAWFQSTMTEKMGIGDERTNDKKWRKKAMGMNKEIGGMLNSTLNKLPNWKQDKTIYRGETITEAEAQQFQVGSVKTFEIFVSTSQSLSTPISQLGSFLSKERPWGVVYHITSATTGKNISQWSNQPGEEEILFAPKTKFQVTKVISRDDAKKMLQLEVKQV